jgi:glycosyltransferase involved in cell wall biosynthesis
MRIGFVTEDPASDVHHWSGTPYFMARSLDDTSHTIVQINPLKEKWSAAYKTKTVLYRKLVRREYLRDRDPAILKGYARQISRRLKHADVDVVLSTSTIPIAHLECEQPIVFWTDATFAGMLGYYPRFSNLARETLRAGDAMEQSALERSALAIYSSDWAARSAVDYYGADPAKVKVVPFGANLEQAPERKEVAALVASREPAHCKLLFSGSDWRRKGGDVAVEVARALNESGLPTTLTVTGSQPPGEISRLPFVRALGFLSKSSTDDHARLGHEFAQAHFLILPARAECFGVVLCEANAFGVPLLTTREGGIPTVVRDGRNGQSFPPGSPPAAYHSFVIDHLADPSRYRSLALSSRDEYERRLNWRTAAQSVTRFLETLGHVGKHTAKVIVCAMASPSLVRLTDIAFVTPI